MLAETRAYKLLLRLFPVREYRAYNSVFFKRFDISRQQDDSLYLRRFAIFRCPWFGIYLHHIIRSDADACLHDHPWAFVSIILAAGYYEETPVLADHSFNYGREHDYPDQEYTVPVGSGRQRKWKGPGSIRYCPAHWCHRVILRTREGVLIPEGYTVTRERPAWSLVFIGRKCRSWGFFRKDGSWVHWKQFRSGEEEC